MLLFVPAYGMAVDLTEYQIPESFSKDLYLNGAFNFSDGNQPSSSYNGFLSGNYNTRYSSIPRMWSLTTDGRYEFENGSDLDADTNEGYNFLASNTLENYYRETKFFGYGGMDFGYRKTMGLDSADDPFSQVQIGAGYGRVFDATPLAQALRIVEDLKKIQCYQQGTVA